MMSLNRTATTTSRTSKRTSVTPMRNSHLNKDFITGAYCVPVQTGVEHQMLPFRRIRGLNGAIPMGNLCHANAKHYEPRFLTLSNSPRLARTWKRRFVTSPPFTGVFGSGLAFVSPARGKFIRHEFHQRLIRAVLAGRRRFVARRESAVISRGPGAGIGANELSNGQAVE